jgi:hypothetical protein
MTSVGSVYAAVFFTKPATPPPTHPVPTHSLTAISALKRQWTQCPCRPAPCCSAAQSATMASRLTSTAVTHVLASTRALTQYAHTAPCASPSARSVVVQTTARSTAASPRRPRPALLALARASPMTTALRRNTVSTATRVSAPGMKVPAESVRQRRTYAHRSSPPSAAAAVRRTVMPAQRQPQAITSSTRACASPRTRLSLKTVLCGLTAATSAPASRTNLFLPAQGGLAKSWSCPSVGVGRLGLLPAGRGATVPRTSTATLRRMELAEAFQLSARASSLPTCVRHRRKTKWYAAAMGASTFHAAGRPSLP